MNAPYRESVTCMAASAGVRCESPSAVILGPGGVAAGFVHDWNDSQDKSVRFVYFMYV